MDASIVVGDCISICSFPMAMVRRECAKSDQSKAIARKMAIDVKLAKCIAAGGVYRPLTLPMMMCCGRQQCLLILIDKVSNILQSIVHIDTQGFQSVVVDQKSDHGIPICRHLEGALVFGHSSTLHVAAHISYIRYGSTIPRLPLLWEARVDTII